MEVPAALCQTREPRDICRYDRWARREGDVMSDDDMDGLDHLDTDTAERLGRDAADRYALECRKAAKAAKAVHHTRVDAIEVVLEDDKGKAIVRYPWIYDAVVGMARLK
jgi:hypothetical protein